MRQDSVQIVDTAYLSYADMRFRDAPGRWWTLMEWVQSQPPTTRVVDVWVQAGKTEQVPVRLIALRLPEEVVQRRKRRANREVERRPHSADQATNPGSACAGNSSCSGSCASRRAKLTGGEAASRSAS
jgi:hypothetical protein